jgi:hypothetical protein
VLTGTAGRTLSCCLLAGSPPAGPPHTARGNLKLPQGMISQLCSDDCGLRSQATWMQQQNKDKVTAGRTFLGQRHKNIDFITKTPSSRPIRRVSSDFVLTVFLQYFQPYRCHAGLFFKPYFSSTQTHSSPHPHCTRPNITYIVPSGSLLLPHGM